MRNEIFIALILIFTSGTLAAQNRPTVPAKLPPALLLRGVSGIVKDSTDQTVIGATITLTSKKDTLRTATNEDGVFIFEKVKEATFVITIKAIGFTVSTRKYLNNDAVAQITLDPIILKNQSTLLSEVKINGKPSILYKTDTVEYRASDYKVRENATVDELLKKMEGMEVGADGTLKYQGQLVTSAKLNGKDFAGGDVSQAIKNLPADIVEKAQIINDYGDQAARTGIKDGIPNTILNLTTKASRSVGDMLRLTVGDGSNDRYDERIFAERINANEQLGLIGNISNTVNGVAAVGANPSTTTGTPGANGGTTTAGGPSINYRDQWGKNIQVNASYTYLINDVNLINSSSGQSLSSLGTTSFNSNSKGINNTKQQKASFEFEFTPDSADFLRITPTFTYIDVTNNNNVQNTETGFQNQYSNGVSTGNNSTPAYGAIIFYQHVFRKHPRRNLSLQFNLNYGNQQQNTTQNTTILYRDSLQRLLKDSLVHRIIDRGNISKNYRSSFTYTEPLTKMSQLDFNAQINYRGYSNNAVTNNVSPTGFLTMIDSLSNNYKYSFTETRFTLNYKINKHKYFLSIGATGIPTVLSGNNISQSTQNNRSYFYLIPSFNFQYQFSVTEQLSLRYTGSPTEPGFTQIQPFPDYTDPQNPVYGNPDLKPSFTHTVTTNYSNYIPNAKLNLSGTVTANFYRDQVITNVIQIAQPVLNNYLNEIHYLNFGGANSIIGNYNVSKQLDGRNYSLFLNGTIAYNYDLGMSNNVLNHLTTWKVNERLGPQLIPSDAISINPFISYDITRTFNSIPSYNYYVPGSSDIRTTALNMEGKFYFAKDRTFTFAYNISKNYISGIPANISKNPLVANFYVEKEFFSRKNGLVRVSTFDLFNQNNFIYHVATPTGYTDTKTNALSRYVSVSLVLYLQKWSGIAKKDGKLMQRRGDGSFIY